MDNFTRTFDKHKVTEGRAWYVAMPFACTLPSTSSLPQISRTLSIGKSIWKSSHFDIEDLAICYHVTLSTGYLRGHESIAEDCGLQPPLLASVDIGVIQSLCIIAS